MEEPRGRSQYVPLTLLREKGTYGTVTVNFEVSIARTFLTLLRKKKEEEKMLLIILHILYLYFFMNSQIFGGPNPANEDLSPDMGNITIPPGRAVVVFSIMIQDDKVPFLFYFFIFFSKH